MIRALAILAALAPAAAPVQAADADLAPNPFQSRSAQTSQKNETTKDAGREAQIAYVRRAVKMVRKFTQWEDFEGTHVVAAPKPLLGRSYHASWGNSDAFGVLRFIPAKGVETMPQVMADAVELEMKSCQGDLSSTSLPQQTSDLPMLRMVSVCREHGRETVFHHLVFGAAAEFLEILIVPQGDLTLAAQWADSLASLAGDLSEE